MVLEGEDIRNAYLFAVKSTLTETGISDLFRFLLEMQWVGCFACFSLDHTHGMLINYREAQRFGATAIADVLVDTGEIATSVAVTDTSMAQVAHALESLARRSNFRPTMFSTDTWPCNKEFFGNVFLQVAGFLGLFHFLNRVYKTLDQSAPFFYKAIQDLRKKVLLESETDHHIVREGLLDGTANRNQPMTIAEAAEFIGTKEFRDRFSSNIRSIPRRASDIRIGLEEWKSKYKDLVTESKRFFSADTLAALENGSKHADHLTAGLWENEGETAESVFNRVYQQINKGRGRIPTYKSSLGTESRLESFHATQARFANLGMRTELADVINMDGVCRHNRDQRHRFRVERLSEEAWKSTHYKYREKARHQNHRFLTEINKVGQQAGLENDHFPDVEKLPEEDNGERFFLSTFTSRLKEI